MSDAVKRFEDLDSWKLARKMVGNVYHITKKGPIVKDYGFVDQIRRASVSVMNNLAEGYERGSNKDFAKFVFYAKGSAGEVRSMLYIACDLGYIAKEEFDELYSTCVRISQLSWGLIKHLRKSSDWKTSCAISLFFFVNGISHFFQRIG